MLAVCGGRGAKPVVSSLQPHSKRHPEVHTNTHRQTHTLTLTDFPSLALKYTITCRPFISFLWGRPAASRTSLTVCRPAPQGRGPTAVECSRETAPATHCVELPNYQSAEWKQCCVWLCVWLWYKVTHRFIEPKLGHKVFQRGSFPGASQSFWLILESSWKVCQCALLFPNSVVAVQLRIIWAFVSTEPFLMRKHFVGNVINFCHCGEFVECGFYCVCR